MRRKRRIIATLAKALPRVSETGVELLGVGHPRIGQFREFETLEARDADGIKAPGFGLVPPSKRANAAMSAEDVMRIIGLIIFEIVGSPDHTQVVGTDDRAPHARLHADGAIAFDRSGV
jgi:hypothetical protein